MPESARYNTSSIQEGTYPSTRGLSVQYVDRIKIYTDETAYVPGPETNLLSINLSNGWNFISVPRVLNAENALEGISWKTLLP